MKNLLLSCLLLLAFSVNAQCDFTTSYVNTDQGPLYYTTNTFTNLHCPETYIFGAVSQASYQDQNVYYIMLKTGDSDLGAVNEESFAILYLDHPTDGQKIVMCNKAFSPANDNTVMASQLTPELYEVLSTSEVEGVLLRYSKGAKYTPIANKEFFRRSLTCLEN